MRLLGILLIFPILITSGLYGYFGVQDWKGRQQINAAGFRHLLVLQGLPLEGENFAPDDETPFVVPMVGGAASQTVSKKLIEGYFNDNTKAATGADQAAGAKASLATNAAVVSQVAEVKRVLAQLKAELEAATPAQKVALIAARLQYQAETMDERLLYRSLAAPVGADGQPKSPERIAADADQLAHLLDLRFYRVAPKLYQSESAALAPAKWLELQKKIESAPQLKPAAPTDEGDRRDRVAHLLVHLGPDAAWQKRVAVIVGLRHYVHAVANQATRFREMRESVEQPIVAEQASFQRHIDQLLGEARQNVDKARGTAEERAKLVERKTAADDAASQRRTQIKELTAQLEKVRAEVDQLLVQQTGIEQQLYEIQREVGLTLEEVYRLEAFLVDVERERYGAAPRSR